MKKEDVYARMMHTPDDPERAELRAALRETWKQLLPLHRALIDSAREEYTAGGAPLNGPGHLLQLRILRGDALLQFLDVRGLELVFLGDECLDMRVNVFGHGSSTSFRFAAESPRVAAP